ncbi:hypothetical protein BDV93DRAFT_194191 [Ceratobasidium sp. AG-I]|nr:hypothetical protein BDV93DRAFT_194191 [Ceratobasidium sp. AG-I]
MPRPLSTSSRAGRRPLAESDRPPRHRLLPASAGGNATRRHTRVPVSTAGEPAAPTRSSPCSPRAPTPGHLNNASPLRTPWSPCVPPPLLAARGEHAHVSLPLLTRSSRYVRASPRSCVFLREEDHMYSWGTLSCFAKKNSLYMHLI